MNGQEVENFCRRMKLTPSPYITAALKTDTELSAEGLNLLFAYYNVNQPQLLNHIKVETLLIYGTFKDVNDKEKKRTEQAVTTVNTYKAPIKTIAVEGGHYVLWEDDFPWSDVRQFLTAGIIKEE
ncbi:hypothetical protein ERX35_004885 [Macrococcus equipercicus]|uniref:Alpha/beta hydrolase n=1 Tax=Macrococcus equipercicus TaxID=69967 RepID=A0ABQ6RAK8_9STAP|nr:hypothetical protein [Macrococcus equipercicus]KAA1040331.1 hypothetical protein ERX35_004885 [Macrococcus equipercicus]